MIVSYLMKTNDEKYEFKSVGKLENNILTFKDNLLKNNTIAITLHNDYVKIERTGKVSMEMSFSLEKECFGFYKNDMNYSFDIKTVTKELKVEKNSLFVKYESYFNQQFNGLTEIMVNF